MDEIWVFIIIIIIIQEHNKRECVGLWCVPTTMVNAENSQGNNMGKEGDSRGGKSQQKDLWDTIRRCVCV